MIRNYDNILFTRAEKNGILVFSQLTNRFLFYEDISLPSDVNDRDSLLLFLSKKNSKISKSLTFSRPFKVNWLIEKRCNLDCVYCYANDKMKPHKISNESIRNTIDFLKMYEIINIGITGGEPILNPHLPFIIESLSGYCALTLDTNGSLATLGAYTNLLKNAGVHVRITVDSIRDNILTLIREPRNNNRNGYFSDIEKNVVLLKKEGVLVSIHSVATKTNLPYLKEVGNFLIENGIKRWHIYGVCYSEKCKNIYDKLKVNDSDLLKLYQDLQSAFGAKIDISIENAAGDGVAGGVLFLDDEGKYFIDTIKDGIRYIGQNPKTPTIEEFKASINVPNYLFSYLQVDEEMKTEKRFRI